MTNGVVSVVVNGKVAMKFVAGCDGYNAPKVAAHIRTMGRVPNLFEASSIAATYELGCKDCLVIQEPNEDHFYEPLGERYRDTFGDPRANPRWEHEADYTEVIEL